MVDPFGIEPKLSESKSDALPLCNGSVKMAAPEGFEPPLLESESSILPIILRSNEIEQDLVFQGHLRSPQPDPRMGFLVSSGSQM